jgi:hypothetical protein
MNGQPQLNAWPAEECERIRLAVAEHGRDWYQLQQAAPTRTERDLTRHVKERYVLQPVLGSRGLKWSAGEVESAARVIALHGTDSTQAIDAVRGGALPCAPGRAGSDGGASLQPAAARGRCAVACVGDGWCERWS